MPTFPLIKIKNKRSVATVIWFFIIITTMGVWLCHDQEKTFLYMFVYIHRGQYVTRKIKKK